VKRGWGWFDVRALPPVRGEEEVDRAVVQLGLGLEVRVDHLSDFCCAVCRVSATAHH
jgi:hypothetical protein